MPAKKEFQNYLISNTGSSHVGHSDYTCCPSSAFLKYLIEAKNAMDLCGRKLPKKNNGDYTKDSLDTLQHLQVSFLPTIMGHFETYQRYLFAGMFDRSIYIKDFNVEDFFKKLEKQGNIQIDPMRIAAYRGTGVSSMGNLLADSLSGWYSAEKVSSFFNCFNLNHQFWSKEASSKLNVLWQLRHSIVHTGGTLTLADAQKVKELEKHGDQQIVFADNFVYEVARKLHPMIKTATTSISKKFIKQLVAKIEADKKKEIKEFFAVKSTMAVWLR